MDSKNPGLFSVQPLREWVSRKLPAQVKNAKGHITSSRHLLFPFPCLQQWRKKRNPVHPLLHLLTSIELPLDECSEYWYLHYWKLNRYSLTHWKLGKKKCLALVLCVHRNVKCHQLSYKKVCFRSYKNGEEKALKSEKFACICPCTKYLLGIYHLSATAFDAQTTILDVIDIWFCLHGTGNGMGRRSESNSWPCV